MENNENEFMQHNLRLPELTLRGMLLGAILTVIFTASNVYLGLKVGLTFSSAIPAAVISMAVLKMARDANILENNMVQTQASAAGTLSAIIFVIPGMLMIGYWQDFEFWQTLLVSACGGCLGVLFTIPLRRAMVVNSSLVYPEGVAAAEILKVGSNTDKNSSQGSGLREITFGGIVAGILALFSNGFHMLSDGLSLWFHVGRGMTQFPIGYSIASVNISSDKQGRHRMDIDMSIKSIGLVFAMTVAGLLFIFYAFVSPEKLPLAPAGGAPAWLPGRGAGYRPGAEPSL